MSNRQKEIDELNIYIDLIHKARYELIEENVELKKQNSIFTEALNAIGISRDRACTLNGCTCVFDYAHNALKKTEELK